MPSAETIRPIDRGWAWVVLAASTVHFFIFVGFVKSFGIFFVAYLKKYDATSSGISLVISIQTISSTLSSVIVLGIGTRFFTERTLVMFGAFLTAVSQIGSAFASSVGVLMATQGVIFGIGVAMSQLALVLILSRYFEKKRGFANSFANVGGSIGGLLWPILLKISMDYLGLSGTLLIVSGMFLQAIVCGALMRPLPSEGGKIQTLEVRDDDDTGSAIDNDTKDQNVYEKSNGTYTLPNSKTHGHRPNGPVVGRRRTQSENIMETNKVSNLLHRTAISTHDLQEDFKKLYLSPSLQTMVVWSSVEKRGPSTRHQSKEKTQFNENANQFFNFALFKNPLFYVFTVSSILNISAAGLPVNYIPPLARDCGLTDEKIALLVTICAACDLVNRIGLTFIADSKTLKRHQILAITMLLNGLSCMFVRFYDDFYTLIIYSVLHGLFGQTYFSLFPAIIVDFLGLDNLRHGLTTITVTLGISVSMSTVLIGELRDYTGSYLTSFYFMGATAVLGGFVLLMEPFGRRMMVNKKKDGDSKEMQPMMDKPDQIK
ncbi:monocarboxylate transporter 9-like [Saccostrea echinata]|uniref:monocarboxylate transporter 9-like n=1 Tax=Saccostrea echinata TaxID=191078 RepID=UPI002A82E80E|nr:monocarboxylate transporter 9-like [Saccostrea echinata]